MRFINPLNIAILLCGVMLWQINVRYSDQIISFYGYAENKETEINFNHPVLVRKICVSPGQLVSKGMPLLEVVRNSPKLDFEDEPYEILRIEAEKRTEESQILGEIEVLKNQKALKLTDINGVKEKLLAEAKVTRNLYEGLQSVEIPKASQELHRQKIQNIEKEYHETEQLYDQKIANKKQELKSLIAPYNSRIERQRSKMSFKKDQSNVVLTVEAPKDGLIGNIYCKEAEHFSSYKTLMSFYEPNPSMIKGFIQEDFIMKISLNDSLLVKSTKDDTLHYKGLVTGLGSRVVEIPDRLRKRTAMKTYGREIIVSIPNENKFLQKEKIILELVSNRPEHSSD